MATNNTRPTILTEDKPGHAYTAIKDLLFRRVLNPGQKLLYRDLCELVGLSKTPIINALNRLVYEGFVLYEPNRGYRIAPVDEKSISHLWEIRLELECINVRNAIKNFSRKNYATLQKKLKLMDEYNPEFTDRKKLELDMDMHMEIARMGGNKFSGRFLKTVLEHIHFMHRLERGVDRRKEQITHEHDKIIESIGNRDDAMAEKYMRTHIEALHHLMLDHLQELKQTEGNFWS
ncbi:MAG: GntR family transcriptional regulator [Desulfobacterales bacterium]|nr:GntR family transcriptional regulator [Desulfobacterales bacterium]